MMIVKERVDINKEKQKPYLNELREQADQLSDEWMAYVGISLNHEPCIYIERDGDRVRVLIMNSSPEFVVRSAIFFAKKRGRNRPEIPDSSI
ncbi:MAG: hypothetical protein GXP04_08425 [Alphaproteobacteria bacterium]|nr:hypothetical protein [Alphaproteobacteria bacterium]